MAWIKIALSLGVLGILLWTLDIQAIGMQLARVNVWWVVAACLLLVSGQILSALRWAWLARGLGLSVNTGRKIRLYFLGMFLSLFLPSIIGGDVARGYLLARGREQAGWPAAASVILERLNGVVGLVSIVAVAIWMMPLPALWLYSWLTGVVLLWLLMLSQPLWWSWFSRLPLPEKLSGWKALPLTGAAFRRAWLVSLPVSILFQLLVVAAHVLLGMAVGLQLSLPAYAIIVCLVALASALPISLNGLGVREAGYVGLAVYFGGNAEAAAAMAVLWLLVLLLAALPGGMMLWRLGGTKTLK